MHERKNDPDYPDRHISDPGVRNTAESGKGDVIMYQQISIFDILEPPQESRFTSECRRGSGFENGKIRIYCASLKMNQKELASFLSDEYGIGGHSSDFPDGGRGFTDYNGKGMIIREWKTNETEKYTWTEVAREIKRLILSGDYLDQKDRRKIEALYESIKIPASDWKISPRMQIRG